VAPTSSHPVTHASPTRSPPRAPTRALSAQGSGDEGRSGALTPPHFPFFAGCFLDSTFTGAPPAPPPDSAS